MWTQILRWLDGIGLNFGKYLCVMRVLIVLSFYHFLTWIWWRWQLCHQCWFLAFLVYLTASILDVVIPFLDYLSAFLQLTYVGNLLNWYFSNCFATNMILASFFFTPSSLFLNPFLPNIPLWFPPTLDLAFKKFEGIWSAYTNVFRGIKRKHWEKKDKWNIQVSVKYK